ncbi:hypothetical protein RhiirA1_455701 [Rhizophagus irregularis]|uniref:Uncharacterized protein n=1 Tax=Rhizophagus irregularis TaxID=588596 RepID=A0A2N0S2B9_9GLOM|nr:hypothetical protein RhiirA1_455701 [Rhizophagus irregularis]
MHKEDVHWKFTEQGTKTILIKRGMKEKQGGMKGRQREIPSHIYNETLQLLGAE